MIDNHISGVQGCPIFVYKILIHQIKSIMIYFDIKNIKISLSFGFFFVFALLSSTDDILIPFSLIFCLLHEFAHLFFMKRFGVCVNKIHFYGGGIKISSSGVFLLSKSKQILVYLSGCALNMILAIIYFLINANELFVINFSLAILNMMPIYYLDGGMILCVVFPNGERILKFISIVFSVLLITLAVVSVFIVDYEILTSSLITAFIILISLIIG